MRPLRRPPVRRPVPPVPVKPVPRRPMFNRTHTTPPTSTNPEHIVTNPNLSAARAYILTVADWSELETITQAIRDRRTVLNATISPGQPVRLSGLRRCYLNRLTGSIHGIDPERGRADVELDEASTRTLRHKGGEKYQVPQEQARYVLRGIPLAACIPTS